MRDDRTVGERLVGRPLTMENRAGVPHYVTGQHHAGVITPEELRATLDELGIDDDGELVAELSYVDAGGHAVCVLVTRAPGEGNDWEPQMIGRAGVRTFLGWRTADEVPFEFSEKMRDALAKALAEAGLS